MNEHTLPDDDHQRLRDILHAHGIQPILASLLALADGQHECTVTGHQDLSDISASMRIEDSINTMEMLFERVIRLDPSPSIEGDMTKYKKRTITTYTIEHNGREFEVEFEPDEYADALIQELPDGRVVIGYVSDDPDPHNPRKDDQLGVMVCWHRRYNLGDEHDHKGPDALWRDLLGDDEYEKLDQETDAELEAWSNAHARRRHPHGPDRGRRGPEPQGPHGLHEGGQTLRI